MPQALLLLAASALLLTIAGCDGSGGALKIKDPKLRAETLWAKRCAACHGLEGKGDGSAVKGIRITPQDLSRPQWQKSRDDARIKKVILEGGPSVGLSHVMAPNLDLVDDPEAVDELVKIIRGLEKK